MSLFSVVNVNIHQKISYPRIEISENRTTFLCGKSGSGKSTLLKLLNATVSPETGAILYRGRPLSDFDTISLRREILLVSQNVFLFDDTIQNNFKEFYDYRGTMPPDERTTEDCLRLCLADFPIQTKCHEMSGGERQRVFIALCLSFMPRVLMLDEPTSALDGDTSHRLMGNLKQFCMDNHITLIVITHDKNLADEYADELILLDKEASDE